MVRSAASGVGQQGHDAAAAALARLSSSLKPHSGIRLPAVLSLRVLMFILVVVLSLGVLVPIVSRSRSGLNAVATLHAVPRLPHTANLHVGTNWRRYTLRQAAQVRELPAENSDIRWPMMCCNFFLKLLQIARFGGVSRNHDVKVLLQRTGSGKRWRADRVHSEPALPGVSQQLAHQPCEAESSPGSPRHCRRLRHA